MRVFSGRTVTGPSSPIKLTKRSKASRTLGSRPAKCGSSSCLPQAWDWLRFANRRRHCGHSHTLEHSAEKGADAEPGRQDPQKAAQFAERLACADRPLAPKRQNSDVRFEKAFVPYGGYWSTPFVRWQGSLAQSHPVKLAAEVAGRALEERGIEPTAFDSLFYGMTVPSPHSFYAAPWVAGMIGNPEISGPTVMQACATSARMIGQAASEVEADRGRRCILGIAADRTSNGPHIYYPDAGGPGGRGTTEDWVWDNFQSDPYADASPTVTAENVAREQGISREEQDEVTLIRYEQYIADRRNGGGFHRRYMVSPLDVRDASGRKVIATVDDDEGITPTTAEGLARLKPVQEGGSVTYGSQTHPADGNCAR